MMMTADESRNEDVFPLPVPCLKSFGEEFFNKANKRKKIVVTWGLRVEESVLRTKNISTLNLCLDKPFPKRAVFSHVKNDYAEPFPIIFYSSQRSL